MRTPINFDRIARPYRWLEYASLGRSLERARCFHLPRLARATHALILGDGDGRFTSALLQRHTRITADAVDLSRAMLRELLRNIGPEAASRVTACHTDVRDFQPVTVPDLVVTHFLLDCLTQPEANALILRLAGPLAPGSLWLVSEFRAPPGPLHLPARALIRILYVAFRVLTGLRVTRVPDFATPLARAGMRPIAMYRSLGGILTSELWERT